MSRELLEKLLLGACIFGALVVAVLFFRRTTPPRIVTDLSHPTVVKEMRQLGRLETAQFTLEKVIDSQVNQPGAIRQLLFGDRILLIAHGQVTAGVDLENLPDQAVTVSGTTLRIVLPDTELFSSSLDPDQTRVFDRNLGFLTKGDVALESEARKSAEGALRTAACESGILEQAKKGAEERLKQFYTLAGFTTVTVEVKAGHCD